MDRRNPKNYKTLEKKDDEISKKTLDLYKKGKFYTNEEFTLEEKFKEGEKIIGELGGRNSWSHQLFTYDISKYDLKDIYIPTIQGLLDGTYHDKQSNSDYIYVSSIKYILNNIEPWSKMNKIPDLEWLIVNNREIFYKLLKDRIEKKRSISTFNNDIKMITRILKITFGKENELYLKYSILQTDLNRVLIERETGKNQLNVSKKDKFIDWVDIISIREELENEFRRLLKEKGKDDIETKKRHYQMLLLSSYTLTSPTRLEIMTAVFSKEKKYDDNDYIYIPNKGLVWYILNKKKKGKDGIEYEVGYNKESGEKLSELFRESLKLYPRHNVFPLITNFARKARTSTITKYLRDILSENKLTQTMIRTSYNSWRHNLGIDYNSLKDDAMRQRNSVDTQMKDYRKLDKKKVNDKIEIKKIEIVPVKEEPIKDYYKGYYDKHKDEIKEKRREKWKEDNFKMNLKKNIRRYNKGLEPNKSTIEKYKLVKGKDGLWESELL
tara:strand:+ start:3658 stop:5142 length:1485 start_codon:yes stop_codon:yes gene_type:complete